MASCIISFKKGGPIESPTTTGSVSLTSKWLIIRLSNSHIFRSSDSNSTNHIHFSLCSSESALVFDKLEVSPRFVTQLISDLFIAFCSVSARLQPQLSMDLLTVFFYSPFEPLTTLAVFFNFLSSGLWVFCYDRWYTCCHSPNTVEIE